MSRPARLVHLTSRGKRRDWVGLKRKSLATAEAYREADAKAHGKRAATLAECANRLEFERRDGQLALKRTWRCRMRHCATCQSIKSRQDFAVLMARVMVHAGKHPSSAPILLTLTVPNVAGPNLKAAVGHLLGAFRKLVRMSVVVRAIGGWHRSLEITKSERGDFHPHVHALLFVRSNAAYFAKDSAVYITQARWSALWKSAAGLAVDPIVWVNRVGRDRPDGTVDIRADGLYEVVKYVVSPESLYAPDGFGGWTVDPATLATIHAAVRGRRLRDVGGTMRAIKKADLPDPKADADREAAHAAMETYEFGDWVDPEHGEIHGPDYWQRAPPDDASA